MGVSASALFQPYPEPVWIDQEFAAKAEEDSAADHLVIVELDGPPEVDG